MSALAPTPALAWPAVLAGTPAVMVIERAIEHGRLSHSLLLHGDDLPTLTAVALGIADRLLYHGVALPPGAKRFPPDAHPDCFHLRPGKKMRQIGAEATRTLINQVQVSASSGPRKVAIIHEADRMHVTAANIFLKTLEEPPTNTTLLLTTTRPYALLPTIRSRVLQFRFPTTAAPIETAGWPEWRADYSAWVERLASGHLDKRAASASVMAVYGLLARFGTVLETATKAEWEKLEPTLPPDLDDDEKIALETGLANGLRARLFIEIEQATRAAALPRLTAGDETARRALVAAIERLEHSASLLRLNLNESTALEDFLLASLRLWTRR